MFPKYVFICPFYKSKNVTLSPERYFAFFPLDFDALCKGGPGSFVFSALVFSQLRAKKWYA